MAALEAMNDLAGMAPVRGGRQRQHRRRQDRRPRDPVGRSTPVDPETLADLQVLVTIKGGEVINEAREGEDHGMLTPPVFGDPEVAHLFLDAMWDGFER
jgi:hypothetical protein